MYELMEDKLNSKNPEIRVPKISVLIDVKTQLEAPN